MRDKFKWGTTSYVIFNGEKIVLDRDVAACFSTFMSGSFKEGYTKIRLREIDCSKTFEYKEFYLNYIKEMFQIESSFNDDYFEFESTGVKMKDAAVMTVVRFLWENIGNLTPPMDTPNLFFKRLRDDECPHEDKLERFCYFYNKLKSDNDRYFSDGHSWSPKNTVIKSTKQFVEHVEWSNVNSFFTRI